MTFKTGDKVRVTPEYTAWYRRNGIGAPPVKPSDVLIIEQIDDDGIIRFREDVESPARIGMTLPEYLVSAEPDHTAAVIEAARAVLKHVATEIQTRRSTGESWLRISFVRNGTEHIEIIEEGDDEPPDTLLTTLAGLRAAIDAYDEAETESDNLTTESEE